MTATTLPPMTFREAVAIRVAAADQLHTLDRVAALTPGRTTATAPSAWFRTAALDLMKGLAAGRVRLCPHLGPGRDFGPMYCALQKNPEIVCRDCVAAGALCLDPIEEMICDRCAVYARGLVSGALPIGPLLMTFGLCGTCSTELGVTNSTKDQNR